MKGLLIVAGLAAAVAVVSGVLLLAAPRSGEGGGAAGPGGPGPGGLVESAPWPGAAGAPPEIPPEVEKRLRLLEIRLEEIQGQLLLLGGSGSSWTPGEDGGEGILTLVPGEAGEGEGAGPGTDRGASPGEAAAGDEAGESAAPVATEVAARTRELKRRARELRRELEIQRRLEQMAVSMNLQPVEKERLDEIVRGHVARTDEVGARARELLKNSAFGLAPGDRATLEQVTRDRSAVNKETEAAILTLVGKDRWKRYRKSVKDQNDKERALRRLGQPW